MPDRIKETSKLQHERSELLLKSVPVLIEADDAFSAVNRFYYAVFHAIKAIEIFNNIDSKKHSGLISNFRQKYIKTGIFDIEYSEILKSLAQYRQDSDYDIFADISLDEAKEQYENAKKFVDAVKAFLSSK